MHNRILGTLIELFISNFHPAWADKYNLNKNITHIIPCFLKSGIVSQFRVITNTPIYRS